MLTLCKECGLQVSDKAIACPHCGFPFHPEKISRSIRTSRRKLPNGFGQITELKSRNLRKPFRAMITQGFNEVGKPICRLLKPVSYFETYNDAYQALMNYHQYGYDRSEETTLKELYEKWSASYFETISPQAMSAHTAAWQYLEPLYGVKVRNIKIKQLRDAIENASKKIKGEETEASSKTKKNIKILMNLLYDCAVEEEIVDKNYARSFNLSKNISKEASKTEKEHIPFTDKERNIMWSNDDDNDVCMILINCYTGFRPYELSQIKIVDVNLTDWFITGGMKTDAGTNRVVPIHSKIKSIVTRKYNEAVTAGSEYLFFDPKTLKPLTRSAYRVRFNKVVKKLNVNPDHRPHDARKDFVTMAKKYKVDEYAIKRIVGHSINDITEKIYTERDLSWLQKEIEKIKS